MARKSSAGKDSATEPVKVPVELGTGKSLVKEGDHIGLADAVSRLLVEKFFVFDTETDGLHFMLATMDGVGFYLPSSDSSVYINMYGTTDKWRNTVVSALKPVFESDSIGKIGHNIIYDMHILANVDVSVNGPILDTMIAAYLANPDDRPFKLKVLVPKHLKIAMKTYAEVNREDILDMAVYCMEDARCTYLLYLDRKTALVREELWTHFLKVEMPFLKVLFSMERIGIKIDIERLCMLKRIFEKGQRKLKSMFYMKMFGKDSDDVTINVTRKVKGQQVRISVPFNIDSTDHLGELLYNIKRIPVRDRTKKGNKPSTDKNALSKLASEGHDGLALLMKYREIQKLLTGFITPMLDEHQVNGRVHSSYLQHGTRTGRLSSSSPNFQNIPVRSSHGKAIRRCFLADPGYRLIDADLSQIELRLMGHFSMDPNLLKAYKENLDLHDITANLVLDLPANTSKLPQNKHIRTLSKGLNFGLQYGAGPRKFAFLANQQLDDKHKITEDQAKEYIDKYFKRYAGVKRFQILYPKEVKLKGYATTVLGRKRFLPNIRLPRTDRKDWAKAAAAEREALSTLIQGTAADVLKLAMLKAHNRGLKIIAQIHDQLLVLAPADAVAVQVPILKDSMENCGLKFAVPIVADIHVVERWEGVEESGEPAVFREEEQYLP